jgi:hypothetical protein
MVKKAEPKKKAPPDGKPVNRIEEYFEPATPHTKSSGRRTKPEVPGAMKKGKSKDLPPGPVLLKDFEMEVVPPSWTVFHLIGTSPLFQNRPSPETITAITSKQAGEGKPKGGPRNPAMEFVLAAHIISGVYDPDKLGDCVFGISAAALKKTAVTASFRQGQEKNKVENMGTFFTHGPYEGLVELEGPPPRMRMDMVPTGSGKLTPCYRPLFWPWECKVTVKYWENLCTLKDLTMWFHLAGQHVGIGSRRIERSGEMFGSFKLGEKVVVLPSNYEPPFYHRKVKLKTK